MTTEIGIEILMRDLHRTIILMSTTGIFWRTYPWCGHVRLKGSCNSRGSSNQMMGSGMSWDLLKLRHCNLQFSPFSLVHTYLASTTSWRQTIHKSQKHLLRAFLYLVAKAIISTHTWNKRNKQYERKDSLVTWRDKSWLYCSFTIQTWHR